MKRIVFLLILVLPVTVLSAEDIVWGSLYGGGDFRFGIDSAFESDGSSGVISFYPEAEYLIWKPLMGNFSFLDFGVAGNGRVALPLSSGSSISAGIGLAGSLHIGFRGFDFSGGEYLSRIDYFAEAGLKFDFITDSSSFGALFKTGINYYITEKLSAGLFYSYWGGFNGGGISVSIKTGYAPAVSGNEGDFPAVSDFAVEPYLLQFYTLYYAANFAGGHDPESYIEGQGCVHRISNMDSSGAETYTAEDILLTDFGDGRRLWGLLYHDEDELYYYEYITDSDGRIRTVYYNTPEDGIIAIKADPDKAYADGVYSWNDFIAERRAGVSVNVEAGVFDTIEYSRITEDGSDVRWWVSDEVPGGLVSYRMQNDSSIVISELIEITNGNSPELFK